MQADSDYRGYDTIVVRDCDEVVIRNVYVSGTEQHFHIRVEG